MKRFLVCLAGVTLAVVLLYVLSAGPAYRWVRVTKSDENMRLYFHLYRPVVEGAAVVHLAGPLNAYLELWQTGLPAPPWKGYTF